MCIKKSPQLLNSSWNFKFYAFKAVNFNYSLYSYVQRDEWSGIIKSTCHLKKKKEEALYSSRLNVVYA